MTADLATVPLDVRIAAAFGPDTPSTVVSDLIREVRTEASAAAARAEEARMRALDPALALDAVGVARREMEDAAFTRDRMNVASERLVDRLREVRRAERDRQRQARYEIARRMRDDLAKQLAEQYPLLAAKLLVLLTELAESDREIELINENALPTGAQRLLTAELVARGIPGLRHQGCDVPGIVRGVRLPSFKFEPHAPYAWPRPQRSPKPLREAQNDGERAHA